jgi:hypothetical protein
MFDMDRSVEHGDDGWGLIEIDANRRVRGWRDQLAVRVEAVGELGRRAQLGIDETV